METYTDRFGIVHFESPELNIPHGEYPVGSVFYFPQAWLQVLAWGKPATLIGYRELVYPKGERVLSVVFENEIGVTGVHPTKVQDLETGLPVFENPPRPKIEKRSSNTHTYRSEKKPLSKRGKKRRRKEQRKRGK